MSLRNGQEEAVNACGHLMGLNTDETSEAQRIRTAGRGGHARTEEECHAVCPPQPPQTHSPRHSRTPASKWLSLFEPHDKSAGKGRKEGAKGGERITSRESRSFCFPLCLLSASAGIVSAREYDDDICCRRRCISSARKIGRSRALASTHPLRLTALMRLRSPI